MQMGIITISINRYVVLQSQTSLEIIQSEAEHGIGDAVAKLLPT